MFEVTFTFYKSKLSMSYIIEASDKEWAEASARKMVAIESGGLQVKKCQVKPYKEREYA